jgi:prolipoprotein diacylglyceryltransferase
MSTACSVLTADRCFSLFYVAAFAAALALLYVEGRRRTWPTSSWLVVVAAGITFGIIGSRLGAISLADWNAALGHDSLPTTTSKTFVGLILLGTAGIFFVQRFLGFRSTTGDAFALALPVGMAVVRFGCLFGGCCFGKPTSLPWGTTYPPGSLAAVVHAMRGLVLPGGSSLPVHPVQLYEIGLLAIVVAALVRARRYLKQPGSLFLLYLVLHGWSRFLIEFVREGAAGPTLLGLRPLQAGLLVFCAGCATLLVNRERAQLKPVPAPVSSSSRTIAVLGALALVMCVFGGWFTPTEQFVLAGAGVPALVAVAFQLVHSARRAWSRWAAFASAGAAAILLGAGSDTLPPPSVGHFSYYDASLSGGTGSYQEICGGVNKYGQVGVGVARTERWGEFTRLRYGIQGFYHVQDWDFPSVMVRPFVGGECRWAGLEAGALLREGDILPCARLRLGPADIAYVEAALIDHEKGLEPIIKLGIGSSHWDWGSLHAGISDAGVYIEPDVRTNFGLSVSPFVAYGGSDVWQLGVGLRYNFKDFSFAPVGRGGY